MMKCLRNKPAALVLFALILLAGSAFGQTAGLPKTADKTEAATTIVFPNLTLTLCETHRSEFRIRVEGLKATVDANVYEDFGGVILCFDQTKVRSLNAFVRYDFKVKQYVYDNQSGPGSGFHKKHGMERT